MPKKSTEERLEQAEASMMALMKAQKALLEEFQATNKELRELRQIVEGFSGKPHRQRGSKAKLSQEQWLAQRQALAARARASRWSKPKARTRKSAPS